MPFFEFKKGRRVALYIIYIQRFPPQILIGDSRMKKKYRFQLKKN